MSAFGSILVIIITFISCNHSENNLLNDTLQPVSETETSTTIFVSTKSLSLGQTHNPYSNVNFTFESMALFGYDIDFCFDASVISEACALAQIIQFIIFFIYRDEDGIQSRRPIFTLSFCIISCIYLLLIIPSICSFYPIDIDFLPYIAWYLLRCSCMFIWFWTLICKYWFLYFDYNYVIILRLHAMHALNMRRDGTECDINTLHKNSIKPIKSSSFNINVPKYPTAKTEWFQKHKKDFGNANKASVYIAIYFLLCFVLLLSVYVWEEYIIHHWRSLHPYLTTISLIEVIFNAMCYIPFITAIVFTVRIYKFTESWKIKEEMNAIFIVSSVIFMIDTALTWITYLDESTRFALKFMLESMILCWTTLISTIFVTYYIVQKRNKSRRQTYHHSKKSTGFSLPPKRSHNNKKLTRSLSDLMEDMSSRQKGRLMKQSSVTIYGDYEIPLGYILANQIGYTAFLQHCSDELNIENLLFLAHVCYFKKKFLDRIKDRLLKQNAIRKETEETMHAHLDIVNEDAFNGDENEEEQLINDYDTDDEEFIELETIHTPSVANLECPKSPPIIKPGSGFDVDATESKIERQSITDTEHEHEHKASESMMTIKTDVAVYDDGDSGSEYPDDIEWSASNSLAILTFRMCHNFERERNRFTLIDVDADVFGEYVPLYVLATNLYTMFIKENSEYEVNLPSKVRTQLHFFFHQNFVDLEESDKQISEYRLFHIFDKSWGEIWQLMILNSYRRFLQSEHYDVIQQQLKIALVDELPSLIRLIVTHSNNDQHIAHLIACHDPHRRKVIRPKRSDVTDRTHRSGRSYATYRTRRQSTKSRLNSLNVEAIHDLQPISLIKINVEPLPIDEQVHHFGKTMVRVKKANV